MIHHVTLNLRADTLAACVAFYGTLGFREVEAPPGIAKRAIWLQGDADPAQVHLMYSEDDPQPRSGHFALVCPDYDATLARLRSAGHDVDPRREHWGSPRSFVRDPAGNTVELMAWPPGAGPHVSQDARPQMARPHDPRPQSARPDHATGSDSV